MKAIFTSSVAASFALLLLVACANGPCRQLRQPQRDSTQSSVTTEKQAGTSTSPAPVATPPTLRTAATGASSGGPVSTANQNSNAGTAATNVFVFKADGSLQCGMGKAISIEDMEKELKGIKVLSRDKRPDGMMHIQVCGSPTGVINIYEISASQLKEAEARGFKKLEK